MRHPNAPKSAAAAPRRVRQSQGPLPTAPAPQTAVQCHLEAPEAASARPTASCTLGRDVPSAGGHLLWARLPHPSHVNGRQPNGAAADCVHTARRTSY